MPPIKAVLFDCDNTLVLSENLAFEACAEISNEILAGQGIDKKFTGHELMSEFVGQNFQGMLRGLQTRYNFQLNDHDFQAQVDRELGKTIEKLLKKAEPCPGAIEVLDKMQKEGTYKMAIVSSSAMSRVVASVEKTKMDHYFPGQIYSAASSLNPPTSKPNPAIYLHACEKIGVKPGESVAIEDSRSGATAAKNAKIPLIGYVGPYYEEGEDKVKAVSKMLTEECGAIVIMHHWREFDDCLKKVIAA